VAGADVSEQFSQIWSDVVISHTDNSEAHMSDVCMCVDIHFLLQLSYQENQYLIILK